MCLSSAYYSSILHESYSFQIGYSVSSNEVQI